MVLRGWTRRTLVNYWLFLLLQRQIHLSCEISQQFVAELNEDIHDESSKLIKYHQKMEIPHFCEISHKPTQSSEKCVVRCRTHRILWMLAFLNKQKKVPEVCFKLALYNGWCHMVNVVNQLGRIRQQRYLVQAKRCGWWLEKRWWFMFKLPPSPSIYLTHPPPLPSIFSGLSLD